MNRPSINASTLIQWFIADARFDLGSGDRRRSRF
jgi:hypothetical protein